MIQQHERSFLLTQKLWLLFFLCFGSPFLLFSQQKPYDRNQFNREIARLNKEMVVDISKANETLRFLDKKYDAYHNAAIKHKVLCLNLKFDRTSLRARGLERLKFE